MKNTIYVLSLFFLMSWIYPVQAQFAADHQQPEISMNDFLYSGADVFSHWKELKQAGKLSETEGASFFSYIRERPGLAFASSALIPGLGQAANQQWWKTAIFAGIEIGAVYLYFERRNHAQQVERDFWDMADNNWSVVQYANFVQGYSQLDFEITDLLTPEGMAVYQANGGVMPTFNYEIDQSYIDLQALNHYETHTLYKSTGLPFSHVVPAYNSQQYYELVSKYFQFGPGWIDWNTATMNIDGGINDMSPMWREHARIEEEFNDAYRFSSNMVMVIIANHVFSAFDALFTSKLRLHRSRLNTSAALHQSGASVSLKIGL